MGLWGEIFSISSAMAFASKAPTQIGNIVSLFTSFRMIMGVPLLGSIINPLILTSISMITSEAPFSHGPRELPVEAVRLRLRHAHLRQAAREVRTPPKVYDLVTRRVPLHVLVRARARPLDEHGHQRPHV